MIKDAKDGGRGLKELVNRNSIISKIDKIKIDAGISDLDDIKTIVYLLKAKHLLQTIGRHI